VTDLDGFTTECVTVATARLLEEAEELPEIALVLVPPGPTTTTENASDSDDVGLIVGVIVGVVVVVAVAVVVAFVILRKKGSSEGGPAV
jgi:Na+/H+ antiporter NhaB